MSLLITAQVTMTAPLYGYLLPPFGPPCFAIPLFKSGQSYFVQDVDENDVIRELVPCIIEESSAVIRSNDEFEAVVGEHAQLAFAFSGDRIIRGVKERLRSLLKGHIQEFSSRPFLAIDLCEFIGDEGVLADSYKRAAILLADANPKIAARWLRTEAPAVYDRLRGESPDIFDRPMPGAEQDNEDSSGDSQNMQRLPDALSVNEPNLPELVLRPGERVRHPDLGEGVVIASPVTGFVRVFFPTGERQVPVAGLSSALSRSEVVVLNAHGGGERALRAWLCYQAHALPLMDNVSALTSAKIDLLPHQVVLTHRVATASPRRFLIADEVGLGKTIETGLILRELISRGELKRALMVVPAGLVNNWHHELNEVFHLNFEVFGSEGDVTDRRSNAFEKHNLLIASIDTLKVPARMSRLKAAPLWDLVVFDEAHHLTAYRQNRKLVRTQNFKLAEVLREHTRDLLLLSATPHQGDHFRFWMLVQILDPTLFNSTGEMVEHRHRLNSLVFRRTKADACQPDGSTLFARRQVHTEAFNMSSTEKVFYEALVAYLQDGFALAKRQGKSGRGLAFVMAIFQKIAASSFAAVQRTLRRRLIALTVQEALMHDQRLDIDSRDRTFDEVRTLIRELHRIADGRLGDAEVDSILADYRFRILSTQREEQEALGAGAYEYSSETVAADAEDAAINNVSVALPEERRRIKELLASYPAQRETKVEKLLGALGALWRENPQERMVVFATYLGSVEMLGAEIERQYPGQGVTVLKGGDHGAKAAAEKRFKAPDGPRVLICTAAGREGINLQHARILFNFDLPWNPMDLEQRIGRIHRYGQRDTAQIYNLVLADTIEGSIFLLLDEKLKEIGRALGKVDERGQIAEDLRTQILGQLSMQLNYASLYSQALSDPQLHRTRAELETAMANAVEARKVVFELFQDLDGFRLDDYKAMGNLEEGMSALVQFLSDAAHDQHEPFTSRGEKLFAWVGKETGSETLLTTERELSLQEEDVELIGLDHPLIAALVQKFRDVPPEELGLRVQSPDGTTGILAVWSVEARGEKGQVKRLIVPIAVDDQGKRLAAWERHPEKLWRSQPAPDAVGSEDRLSVLRESLEPMLQRELEYRGLAVGNRGFEAKLIGWVEGTA